MVEDLFNTQPEQPKKTRGSRGPSVIKKSKMAKTEQVKKEDIQEVFDFWVETFQKKRAKLDIKRELSIGSAIYDWGIDECKKAILGCSLSDFHMGRNKNKVVYNDIELILRDSEKIERFIDLYETEENDVDY